MLFRSRSSIRCDVACTMVCHIHSCPVQRFVLFSLPKAHPPIVPGPCRYVCCISFVVFGQVFWDCRHFVVFLEVFLDCRHSWLLPVGFREKMWDERAC